MELLQNYPVAFLVTVVLPLITGVVLAIGGYDSLKARSDSDAQLSRIEKNTEHALSQLPNINATLGVTLHSHDDLGERNAQNVSW